MYYGKGEFVKAGRTYDLILTQDDSGGDYNWTTVGLARDTTTGQLYFLSDSGCSCNSFLDEPEYVDLTPVATWQAAVEEVKANMPYHFTEGDVFAFALALNDLRPSPSPKND